MSYVYSYEPAEAYFELIPFQDEQRDKNARRAGGCDRTRNVLTERQMQGRSSREPLPRGYAYLNEPDFARL